MEFKPDEEYCTHAVRLPRKLLEELDRIARLEANFLAPVIRRFLTDGARRHRHAERKREKHDAP